MRRTVLAVVLSVLCLTAGCSFGGAGTSTGPGTGTGTDPGDTATGTTLSPGEAPPGVSDGTLTDESALLSAHTDRLTAAGGVWEVSTNATVSRNGETGNVSRRQQTFIESGRQEYFYQLVNPRSRFTAWGNRSLQVVRAEAGGRERTSLGEAADNRSLAGARLLAPQLHEGALAVESVERTDEGARVTLRATTPPDASRALPENATNVTGYVAELVVDSSGRVVRFEASATYDLRVGGETVAEGVRYDISYRLVSREPPAIQRPGWANETLATA